MLANMVDLTIWVCAVVQVKSEDLKVFVEVLQRLHPEPADMLQLRASEAHLRSKVAKLQADAAGHPLQQTIKQLQQAEVSMFAPAPSRTPAAFQRLSLSASKSLHACSKQPHM